MIAAELLADLARQGFVIAPEGSGVRVAPASRLSAKLRLAIVTHRAELLAALRPAVLLDPDAAAARSAPQPQATFSSWDLPPEWWDCWAERVAICHFDGGLPWPDAERLALADVLRLAALDAMGGGRPEMASGPTS